MATLMTLTEKKENIKMAIEEGINTAESIAEYIDITSIEVCETLDRMPAKYWDMVSCEDDGSFTEAVVKHLRYTGFGATVKDNSDIDFAEGINNFLLATQDEWEMASDAEMIDLVDSFTSFATTPKEVAKEIIASTLEYECGCDVIII
jgi:serine/threonine protein phosphatase PrpC